MAEGRVEHFQQISQILLSKLLLGVSVSARVKVMALVALCKGITCCLFIAKPIKPQLADRRGVVDSPSEKSDPLLLLVHASF
jgi:hypothetical protein